jgi:pimeloyl-ACP methyl ester carboxylesterase
MAHVLMKKTLTFLAFALLVAACKPYPDQSTLTSMSELSYPYEVNYQELEDGINLAYIDEGQGEKTILFIHGLGSYLPAWKKNIDELRDDYRCIAIDLPGYGKSSKGNHAYDMKFFADVVADFIQKQSLKNVTLVGHSMGGQIGVTMSLYYPDLIDQLVLVAPAGFEVFHEGQKQWFRDVFTTRLVKLTSVEAIQSNLAYNFYNLPEEATFMITDRIAMRTASDFDRYCYAIVKSVQGMVDQPVFDFLSEVSHPVLVFYGENDNLIPNRYLNPGFTRDVAKAGISQLKNAELVMLPKTGHFAQFESFSTINQSIKSFIK